MRSQKRGGPPALPPDEAAVTYSRIEDADELTALGDEPRADGFADGGRREPTFTAMRVDPPKRRRETVARVELDDYADEPIALDPEALGAAPRRGRRPRQERRRGSGLLRLVLLVGALAVLGGVGVLGATVMKVLYGGPAVAAATAPDTTATATAADPTAVPVATPESVLPDSGSAGPGVLAIPASEGGPIDMTPAAPAPQPQAALSPVPPPQPETAPAPAMAPAASAPPVSGAPKASASTEAPPLPKATPAATAPAATASAAPQPVTGTDAQIDSALSDVDRLLATKKAPAAPAQTAAPQTAAPLTDQSAALNLNTLPADQPPLLPAPSTVIDSSMPVPPADIPNAGN